MTTSRIFPKLCFLFLALWINTAFAEEINLKITFKEKVDFSKLKLELDDGTWNQQVSFKAKNNQIILKREVLATYGTLEIMYSENGVNQRRRFWIEKGVNSGIDFSKGKRMLDNYTLNHVEDINAGMNDEMEAYIKKEWIDFGDFLIANTEKIDEDASLRKTALAKAKVLNDKTLEYVKNRKKDLYGLWLFERNITEYYPAEELMEVYRSFPVTLSHHYEARKALAKINGYALKTGGQIPSFNASDINGKTIDSDQLSHGYVILSFWSSTCKPCIKEIPALKELKKTYPENQLKIISVSTDSDYRDFIKSKKKYHMDWNHIFNNTLINSSFGVHSIPKTILADNKGKILFIIESDQIEEISSFLKSKI